MKHFITFFCMFVLLSSSCDKKNDPVLPADETFSLRSAQIDGKAEALGVYKNVSVLPACVFHFSEPLDTAGLGSHIQWKSDKGVQIPLTIQLSNQDSVLTIKPQQNLLYLDKYYLEIYTSLKSKSKKQLGAHIQNTLYTLLDTTPKFPLISDDSLMTVLQKETFRFFWDFGHPVSGLSRERNGSGDVVTSGGTGFGIMSIIVAVHRGFITRAEGAQRLKTMTNFLLTKTKTYHGIFPHWLNGTTGATIPFSQKDDGADLVETSYLMQGLLCARQYFNSVDATETSLRAEINTLWENCDWNWHTQGGQKVLYWHWSENYGWQMNHRIQGWNEALITYIMAASSPTHSITKEVYDQGWAKNGAIRNGKSFYGHILPLGWDLGGPLFFAHYTFLGVDPRGLKDQYADYEQQVTNHSLINYEYCKANPKNFLGYSADCWGLTASDTYDGYTAHEPNNDRGVISPTAALSSIAYAPTESKQAMRFFYYTLGDKLLKQYGLVDAFSLDKGWYADSFLAIDQGPIIVMMENHRSGLLWDLFTSCPEVKVGMKKLGFTAPYL